MQSAASRRPDISPQRRRVAHSVAVSGQQVRVRPFAPDASEEFSEPDLGLLTLAAALEAPDSPELRQARQLLADRDHTIGKLNERISSMHGAMANAVEALRRRESELDELRQLLLPAPVAPRAPTLDPQRNPAGVPSAPASPEASPAVSAEVDYPTLKRVSIRKRGSESPCERLSVSSAPKLDPSATSELEFAGEAQFFAGITGDIREGGLFLVTYCALPVGSRLELEFELPEGTSVRTNGVVAWVRETHEPHSERPGVGVAFTELPADALTAIERFCLIRPPLYMEF